MRSKWMYFIVFLSGLALAFLYSSASSKKDDFKKSDFKNSAEGNFQNQQKRMLAVEAKRNVSSDSAAEPAEKLDPLANPFVSQNHARNQKIQEILKSIAAESRAPLSLQIVDSGAWSVYTDLQVTKEPVHNTLFLLGPYHVSRKDVASAGKSMMLVFNEDQQTLAILTGRVVITVRDLYDVDPIVRDYELKLETLSSEIKTAYLDAADKDKISKLNLALKDDHRVERFYFEVVKTEWVRN